MHSVMALFVRLGCVVAMISAAVGFAAPASAEPTDSTLCAWRFMSNSTVLNVAFPDANSTYWLMPYALGPGDSIELSGTYPAARYFSLNTYGTDLDTVDTLRDDQIIPDPGSANPYVDASAEALPASRQRWHATLVNGPADHSRNEIQAVASGQGTPIGFVIIRVYVPTDPNSLSGGVGLPDAKLSIGGSDVATQPCAQPFDPAAYPGPVADAVKAGFDRVIAGAAAGAFPGNTPEAVFSNPASTAGLFPNGDNKYIGTRISYQPGRLLVVRGKAPIFPNTLAGQSPTDPNQQVRYWSMCQNDLRSPYPVVACAADFQTAIDESGYYTYVLGAPADLPANLDPSVTVIPWGSTDVDKVLFLRNMIPSAAFYPNSVQASQDSGADPATTMGPYYPRTAYCDTETLATGGAGVCLGA
ncbi:hypothetical protein [Nocardia alba]|uniref:Uncharacterized protein n=1 Tax=Nocardia alba TaxID=225051 RepID=A0A4R1FXS0_9NOCA|nr:hypothetical protein [Nocardia alba]TCJ99937.1 hypothetical protein DFR71_0923 [Nocardia alba]